MYLQITDILCLLRVWYLYSDPNVYVKYLVIAISLHYLSLLLAVYKGSHELNYLQFGASKSITLLVLTRICLNKPILHVLP